MIKLSVTAARKCAIIQREKVKLPLEGRKPMFRRLFSPDSDLMIVMTWITDCVFLSMFWILGCLPVVTIGASTAALYDAAFYAFRKHSRHSWGRFWKSYVKNLKASLLPTLVFAVVSLAAGTVLIHLWNSAVANGAWAAFGLAAVISVLMMGIFNLLFAMLSRFENSLGQLLGNTVRLALARLPRTVALGIISTLAVAACAWLIIPVFILPALAALLSSLFVEPILRPYLPEDFYEILSED
jgi:uncharacterized membrane protein YesL